MKNSIIGLPEEVRMTDAVGDYVKKSINYLGYLHWNKKNLFNGLLIMRKIYMDE